MPSVYNKNRVTKKGYNLLAESIATKKPVTFTKVVIGDGDDNGLNIDTMTNVVSEKLTLPVYDGQKDGDGQYLVTAVLSNSTVETGFFPKEVALYAKCGDGEEILYSYSNGGNNVGLIPDKNTPINSEIYNIRTKIGNATNITFLTTDDLYVTKSELTKHNADANAHDNRFNAIVEKVNNMITPTDDTDKQSLAPTLSLVKTLLSNLNIKNSKDVIKAIDTETLASLGVRYDLSNTSAWYISFGKLFGGLIIQGGKQNAGKQKQSDPNNLETTTNKVIFPIAFTSNHLFHTFGIVASDTSLFWGNSGASAITRRISRTDMRYEVHSSYMTMLKADSIVEWCVVGV